MTHTPNLFVPGAIYVLAKTPGSRLTGFQVASEKSQIHVGNVFISLLDNFYRN